MLEKSILLLDTDDLLLKSKIKDQVKKIKKNKSFKNGLFKLFRSIK